jgi:hypothetical protein
LSQSVLLLEVFLGLVLAVELALVAQAARWLKDASRQLVQLDTAFRYGPDPCPGHTEDEGPHHSIECCYYAAAEDVA